MFNDYEMSEMARIHREELLEEAKNASLLKSLRVEKPGYRDRLLSYTGNYLIKLGQMLMERSKLELEFQNSIQ